MLEKLNLKLIQYFNISEFDISIIFNSETLFFLFLYILLFFTRHIFAQFLSKKISSFLNVTFKLQKDSIYDALVKPFKLVPIILILLIFYFILTPDAFLLKYVTLINKSLVTILIFWILYSFFLILTNNLSKLDEFISKALSIWIINITKNFIIILGIVALLELWGIKVGPIIAGLGLFGVALALGAQDLFKNLISGLLILVEKKFTIGDVINISNFGEGTVENIGFRSTTIRKFDSVPLTIPNYLLSDTAISNYSRRKYRRLSHIINLEYSTSIDQFKNITNDIKNIILNDKINFIVNENYNCFVRVEKFNDSSVDILIYCFAKTNSWDKYLEIKENLLIKIKKIVEIDNSASFAFPSQSVYLINEKNK